MLLHGVFFNDAATTENIPAIRDKPPFFDCCSLYK